jgi:methylmalonyl-CoA/ethylmalonyl-CoA epimerase
LGDLQRWGHTALARTPPPVLGRFVGRLHAGRLAGVFRRIDHIGVAVEEIDAVLALWRDSFEMQVAHREVVEEQGVEAVLLDVGENHVELLAPLGADTPVGKFLTKNGPGLHHVAYQVTDIDATLQALKGAGMRLIDEQPRTGIRGSRVAFLHPKATAGVLTEIVEPAAGLGAH